MGNIVKTAKCRFCGQMTQIEADEKLTAESEAYAFSANAVEKALINSISRKAEKKPAGRSVANLRQRLNTIKNYM